MNIVYILALAAFCANLAFAEEEKCGTKSEQSNKRNRLLDQDFGLAFAPGDFLTSLLPFHTPWMLRDYFRPWRHLASLEKDLGSTIKSEKNQFQINLDVQHFAPEEITVKTVDGYIVVEAKHEEKQDGHGFVSRQFVRRYSLPDGASPETVVSQLSADGVLTVTAPKKQLENAKERIVPITQTGPLRTEAQEGDKSEL